MLASFTFGPQRRSVYQLKGHLENDSAQNPSGDKLPSQLVLEAKKKIAREIHDGPLQVGVALSLLLKNEYMVNKIPDLNNLISLVDELNYQLRSICEELRPPSLSLVGLVQATKCLCHQLMARHCLHISLAVDNIADETRFYDEVELTAYRVIQESLNNVIRHSGCREAEVKISVSEGCLNISVQDYGKGFDCTKIPCWGEEGERKRLGLIGMAERVLRLNGKITIFAQTGKGVLVKASLPIDYSG